MNTMTMTNTARFELVNINADTGVETVVRSCWTMNEAMRTLANCANGTELRFCGVTLAHVAGTQIAFTAFRTVSFRVALA